MHEGKKQANEIEITTRTTTVDKKMNEGIRKVCVCVWINSDDDDDGVVVDVFDVHCICNVVLSLTR